MENGASFDSLFHEFNLEYKQDSAHAWSMPVSRIAEKTNACVLQCRVRAFHTRANRAQPARIVVHRLPISVRTVKWHADLGNPVGHFAQSFSASRFRFFIECFTVE